MTDRSPCALRVLVVEDDPNIRQLMHDMLVSDGHVVSAVADGETGLIQLQSNQFNLLVTDLGLPGISGWELARAAKRYQAELSILAISSWQGKEAKAHMHEYGVDAIIWKPFRFDEIRMAVANLFPSIKQTAASDGRV